MREGVLLLHGIGPTSRSMRPLARALAAQGFAVCNHDYPSRRHDLATLAAGIAADTAAWRAGLDRLHLVTHSMGGLLARILVARHGAGPGGFAPPERGGILGRTVMLGPPNGGSEIADLLMRFALYHRVYGPAGRQLGTAGWGVGQEDTLADCPGLASRGAAADPRRHALDRPAGVVVAAEGKFVPHHTKTFRCF